MVCCLEPLGLESWLSDGVVEGWTIRRESTLKSGWAWRTEPWVLVSARPLTPPLGGSQLLHLNNEGVPKDATGM